MCGYEVPEISLVDSLTLWNECKLNSPFDIEESNELGFHSWFRDASFLGWWGCGLFPFQILSFTFRIILEAPCFTCSENFWQKFIRHLTRKIGIYINAPIRLISSTTSKQLASMRWNRYWCKFKHVQTCHDYDQVAWLPSSRAIKSFRQLQSHSLYLRFQQCIKKRWIYLRKVNKPRCYKVKYVFYMTVDV
jgi:hypothetical protein